MNRLAVFIASVMAGLAFTVPAYSQQPALLTIRALGIDSMPVYNGEAQMDFGPFWHFPRGPRPGEGKYMVIGGHNVTQVPGYGAHGPFYNLANIKKGYLAEIRWHGKLRRYRFASSPKWHPENDSYVVRDRGAEAIWFYTCWPRYSDSGRLWIEAVLVPSRK